MWIVTIERNGRKQQRMIKAATAEEAGAKVKALVGGPDADAWTVARCVPAE